MNNFKFVLFLLTTVLFSCKNNRNKSCIADDLLSADTNISIPYSSRFPNYIHTSTGLKYKIFSRNDEGDSIFKQDVLHVNYKILIDARLMFEKSPKNQRFLVKDFGFVLPKLTSVLSSLKVGDSVNIFIPKGYYTKHDDVLANIKNNDILFSLKINDKIEKYDYYNATFWHDFGNGVQIAYIDTSNIESNIFKSGDIVDMYYAVYIDNLDSVQLVESNFEALKPLNFHYGEFPFIEGLNMVLPKIKPGQKLKIKIPSTLAYGVKGTNTIPPNSDLIFDIQIN